MNSTEKTMNMRDGDVMIVCLMAEWVGRSWNWCALKIYKWIANGIRKRKIMNESVWLLDGQNATNWSETAMIASITEKRTAEKSLLNSKLDFWNAIWNCQPIKQRFGKLDFQIEIIHFNCKQLRMHEFWAREQSMITFDKNKQNWALYKICVTRVSIV